MGAGHDDRFYRADQGRVDIVFAQRHVGAVFAIENRREVLIVPHAQDDQRGEAFRVDDDALGGDAFAFKLLGDEAAHMFVANPGDQG